MNTTRHEKEISSFCKGKVLLALLGILLLTGCMTTKTSGVKVDPGQLDQIKIGQTTQAEVESLLGKPIRTRKSHGLIELTYAHQQFDYRQMTPPIPIVGIGPAIVTEVLAGKSHLVMEDTIIFIGKDGKVVDIKGLSLEGYHAGLFVKDDSPKADITKANQIRPGITTQEQVKALLGAPPWMIRSQTSTNQMQLWYRGSNEIKQLIIIIRQDGIVDEVKELFRGGRLFPKRVDTDNIAQIKELVSRREAAESILDRPSAISHTKWGDFYIYYIKEGETKEELYIQYDSNGFVTSLTRQTSFTFLEGRPQNLDSGQRLSAPDAVQGHGFGNE